MRVEKIGVYGKILSYNVMLMDNVKNYLIMPLPHHAEQYSSLSHSVTQAAPKPANCHGLSGATKGPGVEGLKYL